MGTIPTPFRKTDHEEPQREVVLDAFYIGKLPLTNAQYSQFLAEKGGYPPHFHDNPRFNASDCPIVGVSWYDALAFLDWLNELTGKSYRLPTEAEWEKAARGTDARIYPWGNEWDASKGNFGEIRLKRTTPVGSYPSGVSPYGCLDMGGNVYEWCSDWFHPETYKYSPANNPGGAVGWQTQSNSWWLLGAARRIRGTMRQSGGLRTNGESAQCRFPDCDLGGVLII